MLVLLFVGNHHLESLVAADIRGKPLTEDAATDND